jgi:phosphoadenosine phosphosulfate reductase
MNEKERFSYHTLSQQDYNSFNEHLAEGNALDIIRWAYDTFSHQLVYACSFGAEGIVLVDLISRAKRDATIIFLDTHVHFKETYELIEDMQARYPSIQLKMIQPELTLAEQAAKHGERLWETNPDLCCYIRKNKPLKQALEGYTAWLSGLRRAQSPTRAKTEFVNKDDKFQMIKICPLIHWSWEDIWQYIKDHNLPYNPLHDQDYPSIGCEPCTKPVKEGDDLRAGRWTGLQKTECGLHINTPISKE